MTPIRSELIAPFTDVVNQGEVDKCSQAIRHLN